MPEWMIAATPDCISDGDGELRRIYLRDGRGRWWSATGLDVNRVLTSVGVLGKTVDSAASGADLSEEDGPPPKVWLMRPAEVEAWAAFMEMGLLRDMADLYTPGELVKMGAEGLASDLRSRLDALRVPMTDEMVETIAELLVKSAAERILGLGGDGQ
ncbi:MAG: hypothetical protein WHU10_00165 [Fimbriimonadales bacterium]